MASNKDFNPTLQAFNHRKQLKSLLFPYILTFKLLKTFRTSSAFWIVPRTPYVWDAVRIIGNLWWGRETYSRANHIRDATLRPCKLCSCRPFLLWRWWFHGLACTKSVMGSYWDVSRILPVTYVKSRPGLLEYLVDGSDAILLLMFEGYVRRRSFVRWAMCLKYKIGNGIRFSSWRRRAVPTYRT